MKIQSTVVPWITQLALASTFVLCLSFETWSDNNPESKPDATIITISDTVVTPGIEHFGVNLGDVPMKERIIGGGFEGVLYRNITFGPAGDATSYYSWFGAGPWEQLLKGCNYMFVSGPRKGNKGKVVDIVQEAYAPRPDKGKMTKYIFDKEGPIPKENDAVILEKIDDTNGYVGQDGGKYWVFLKGGGTVKTEAGDVRPGSGGKAAAVLTAPQSGDVAELMAPVGDKDSAAGVWHLKLWAKGDGVLKFAFSEWNHRVGNGGVQETAVPLTTDWKCHEFTLTIDKYPDGWNGAWALDFQLTGGSCKLDDLSMVRDGDKNPTAFRDEVVETLKRLNPGTLRFLNMGGGSVDNMLASREVRCASAWDRGTPPNNIWPGHPKVSGRAEVMSHNIPEFLALCEEIKANPWVCLPGVMYVEEMTNFMEYLGGPVTSKYGKLRADMGHPKPWTEVFSRINIEIGNEGWNYQCSGFGGPEYWEDLFSTGKKSQYYNPCIKFHAGGQAVWVGRNTGVADNAKTADFVNVAPYIIHEMSKAQAELPEEEFWSFVFGYPWYHDHTGYMMQNYQEVTQKRGKALSVYEVNHHITGGDAPTPPRNRVVAGIGGGLNVANHMLMMLELEKIKVQNLFTLNQFAFFKDVRLWGIVTKLSPDEKYFRPTFMAARMINTVLRGDLVTAAKSGADPKWICNAKYDKDQKPFEVPYVQAYSTRDGKARSVIIFNFHRTQALPVVLQFPGEVKKDSAVISRMEADKIDDNNEPGHEPQVLVKDEKPADFASGATLTLKPFCLVVIKWDEK